MKRVELLYLEESNYQLSLQCQLDFDFDLVLQLQCQRQRQPQRFCNNVLTASNCAPFSRNHASNRSYLSCDKGLGVVPLTSCRLSILGDVV